MTNEFTLCPECQTSHHEDQTCHECSRRTSLPAFEDTIADVASFRVLIELKDSEKKAKIEYERIKKARMASEETVYARMENANIQNINVDNTTLYRKTNLYASISKANKTEGFEWLENNGYEDLIQSSVNARTLAATIKEFIATGGEIPDCISTTVKNTIGIKKAR